MIRVALFLGLFAAVMSAFGARQPGPAAPPIEARLTRASETAPPKAPCPPGTLPDADVCIPVPENLEQDGEALMLEHNAHRTRAGTWTEYDEIPRRPERPNKYRLYRYPVDISKNADFLLSGFDLNLPDADQRRGGKLRLVGHGGIDIGARRGTEVRLVALEHQQGDADVLYVGPLIGNTVVTRHQVRESGMVREYLVFHGHLQAPASGLTRGMTVPEGTVVGFVGDSDSPGAVHLHLEIRQVRTNVDSQSLVRNELLMNARTVACDPRNVLPFAEQP